jgi:hypothetical protein
MANGIALADAEERSTGSIRTAVTFPSSEDLRVWKTGSSAFAHSPLREPDLTTARLSATVAARASMIRAFLPDARLERDADHAHG